MTGSVRLLRKRALKNAVALAATALAYIAAFLTLTSTVLDYVSGAIASSVVAALVGTIIYSKRESEITAYTSVTVSLIVGFLASIPAVVLYYFLRGVVVEMASKMKAYDYLMLMYTSGYLVFTYIVVSLITFFTMSISFMVFTFLANIIRERSAMRKYTRVDV